MKGKKWALIAGARVLLRGAIGTAAIVGCGVYLGELLNRAAMDTMAIAALETTCVLAVYTAKVTAQEVDELECTSTNHGDV